MKRNDFFCLLARIAVGSVLLYAGFIKAAGPSAEFAAAIATYKILPSAFITPLAQGLPYVEMWIGLFVLTGFYTYQAALAAAMLFAVFLATLISASLRGIDLTTCGCFGADGLPIRYAILLDAVLLASSLMISRLNKYLPPWSLDRALQ